jgi:DNA processing protein
VLSKEEKIARLKLARSESIGPSTFWNLINTYGSGEKALRTISKNPAKNTKLCTDDDINKEIQSAKAIGVRFVFWEDELFPPLLRNIPDPPPVLSFLGNKEHAFSFYKKNIISVVGARNASIHANKFCHSLCKELSENGVIVVSGLARGIDTQAHTASINGGTIAILANGINIAYPQENTSLYNEIVKKGCVFAEMPLDTFPHPNLFPRRNRIIAGMSYGTIIVEAAEQSGSLITAKIALEYNRDVFAVPGSPLDPRSFGGNKLIKEGAILVQSAQDVLDCLENKKIIRQQLFEKKPAITTKLSDNDLEKIRKKILDSLSSVPITIDELISSIKVSPQEVLTALLELELANKIVRLHGQRICLALDC